jgi:hypothetical protein
VCPSRQAGPKYVPCVILWVRSLDSNFNWTPGFSIVFIFMVVQWNLGNGTTHVTGVKWSCYRGGPVTESIGPGVTWKCQLRYLTCSLSTSWEIFWWHPVYWSIYVHVTIPTLTYLYIYSELWLLSHIMYTGKYVWNCTCKYGRKHLVCI